MNGFETALQELTLVLFTTMAPSGTFATAVLVAVSAAVRRRNGEAAGKLDQFLWIPLAITLVGLVFSATHLGNPANALYVLLGVGSSPLSNEVAAGVVLLGVAGVYWLLSFSLKPLAALKNALAAMVVLAAAVFITAIAFAYDAATIITWHTPMVPAALWANAVFGGPLLATITLRVSGSEILSKRMEGAFSVVSAIGLVASTTLYLLQGNVVATAENSLLSASTLVPFYMPMVAVYFVLAALGSAVVFLPRFASGPRRPRWDFLGVLLAFSGVFVMRFAFYMMHMTVGVSL